MDVLDFALALVEYRKRLPCSVTSWGRTALHNATVGGAPNSKHQHDLAADVVYDATVALGAREAVAGDLGLILRPETDHDHIEAPD